MPDIDKINRTCLQCNSLFVHAGALRNHQASGMCSGVFKHHVCSTCDKRFEKKASLEEHQRVKGHLQPKATTGSSKRSKARKKKGNVTQKNGSVLPSDRSDDAIDNFFMSYPSFNYNRNRDCFVQFRKLTKHLSATEEAVDCGALRQDFRIAQTKAFGTNIGTSVSDLQSWHNLCKAAGVSPLPETIADCKRVIVATHVNLVDMHEVARRGGVVHHYPTEQALAEYTTRTNRIFPREEAYAGDLLKWLLRQITGTYHGFRGRETGKTCKKKSRKGSGKGQH